MKIIKKFLSVLLVGVGLITFAACNSTTTGEKFTWRNVSTAFPATLNQFAYASAGESDVLSNVMGSLFDFEYNENYPNDGKSYKLTTSMAKSYEGLDTTYPDNKSSKNWKITLRDDLYWQAGSYNGGKIVINENEQKILAEDFLYSWQQLLTGSFAFRRANAFTGATFPVKNARAFYLQGSKDPDGNVYPEVSWDQVGFKAVANDPLSFTIELTEATSDFLFKYNLTSFVVTPVHKQLFEATSKREGTPWTTTYGTKLDLFVGHGVFKLVEWKEDQTLRYDIVKTHFEASKYKITNIATTYVKDTNAALTLFKQGAIDTANIPTSEYESFKDDPRIRKIPGTTAFRMNVNLMTQAQLDAKGTAWTAKPILQELAFRQALYFGLDRNTLAKDVGKVSTAEQSYFTPAYVDGDSGIVYRNSEAGKGVLSDLSPNTAGYSRALALSKYEEAINNLVTAGTITTTSKISVEYAYFEGVSGDIEATWLKGHFEKLFVSTVYPNIKFELVLAPQPNMDVYYQKQIPAKYDLAIAGLSGGTLDPFDFFELFCSDDRGGLFLNWGFDSTVRELVYNGNTYTYDELYVALNAGEFRFAKLDTRFAVMAVLERYLIDKQISIPMISNSGYAIFSDRVKLKNDNYLPGLGFQVFLSELTKADK